MQFGVSSIQRSSDWPLISDSQLDNDANDASGDATMNLFNWHRSNEDGGLWLAEGQEDVQTTRKRNSHAWISYSSDDELGCGSAGSGRRTDFDGIAKWQDGVSSPVSSRSPSSTPSPSAFASAENPNAVKGRSQAGATAITSQY